MAHHYQDFFMSYDFTKDKMERKEASKDQKVEKVEKEEELKEAKCSNMTKQQLGAI